MKFDEIVSEASKLIQRYKSQDIGVWFRGHSNADWPIKSSLHRHVEDLLKPLESIQPPGQPLDDAIKEGRLRHEYNTIFRRFKADAWSILDERERSPWGIVFAMQHYGIPTRLLDWTESFACAVYFAQFDRKREEAASIYALIPEAINRESMEVAQMMALEENVDPAEDERKETEPLRVQAHLHPGTGLPNKEIGYPPTIAVLPFLSNPRMIAQRSVFTMMGDSFLPLEKQFNGKLIEDGCLIRFVLEPDDYDEVQAFLDLVGIGDFGYFPDYEGLRRKLQNRKKRMLE